MRSSSRLASIILSAALVAGTLAPVAVFANSGGESGNYQNYSVEQLEALITKLQKQLEEMKKGSKCFVSDKALSIGDGEPGDGMDGEVKRLQMFLKEKGHFTYSFTGYFGKMTRAAVQSFQRANGLSATGEFDGSTREKAHAMFCKSVLKSTVKNEVKKDVKKEEEKKPVSGAVRSIALKVQNGIAYWSTDGSSVNGFKVVWSKSAGPTYPTRDGDMYAYLGEPSASQSTLKPFDGPGTYRVRVCEYLGGACGVYSNEVTTEL